MASGHMLHRSHPRRPKVANPDQKISSNIYDDEFIGKEWGSEVIRREGWAAEGERPRTPFGKALPDFHSSRLPPLEMGSPAAVLIIDPDRQDLAFRSTLKRTPIEKMLPGSHSRVRTQTKVSEYERDRLRDDETTQLLSSLSRRPPFQVHGATQHRGPTVLMTQREGQTFVLPGRGRIIASRAAHGDGSFADGPPSSLTNGSSICSLSYCSMFSNDLGSSQPWSPPSLGANRADPRSNVPQYSRQAIACTRVFNDLVPRFPPTRSASPAYECRGDPACIVKDADRLSPCFSNAGRRSPIIGEAIVRDSDDQGREGHTMGNAGVKSPEGQLQLDVCGSPVSGRYLDSPTSVLSFSGLKIKEPDRPNAVFMSPVYDMC